MPQTKKNIEEMIKSVGISKPKNNKGGNEDEDDDDDNSDFASNNRNCI